MIANVYIVPVITSDPFVDPLVFCECHSLDMSVKKLEYVSNT